jgi:subtilisin-like proprotein convertase family protein
MAAEYNFTIEKGSAFEIIFIYTDGETLQPINIQNYSVYLRWRDNANNLFTATNCVITTDYSLRTTSEGRIIFQLPAKTTNLFDFDSAIYDLELQSPNEQYTGSGYTLTRILYGTITIVNKNVAAPIPLEPCKIVSDQCQDLCCDSRILDPDSYSYPGSGIYLTHTGSGISTINVVDSGIINFIDISLNNLNHSSPQDLRILLHPPSGDKILLSGHDKITNNRPNFNFTFSNKAQSTSYLYNTSNFGYINIQDKTSIIRLNNENLLSSTSHLIGSPSVGPWSLIIFDDDPEISGYLESWNIIFGMDEIAPTPTPTNTPSTTPTLTPTSTPIPTVSNSPTPTASVTPSASPAPPCGSQTNSGEEGVTINNYSVPAEEGQIVFTYEAYEVEDAFTVSSDTETFVETGLVSGSGLYTFCKPSGLQIISVMVSG